jgi:hypothetical protein
MVDRNTVDVALDSLRPGLNSDGFELLPGELSGSSVEVVLAARPDACLDCLVPEDLMVAMIEAAIRDIDPSVGSVTLTKRGFDAVEPQQH